MNTTAPGGFTSREAWQEVNRGRHYGVGLFNAIRSNPDLTAEECDAFVKTYFDAYPYLAGRQA